MASLRELIEQLHSKMARIRELQALDPNILLLRTPVEAKEFEQLEALEANTKKALEKKEAKQIAKQETPVGLPDPKTMEVEQKQPVETPVGLPDPKTMEVEEKQPVETPVGLPDPKTTEKEEKQPAKTETTPQKVEQKPIATKTEPVAKPQPKAKEEEKSLPIADAPQKTETTPEKKEEEDEDFFAEEKDEAGDAQDDFDAAHDEKKKKAEKNGEKDPLSIDISDDAVRLAKGDNTFSHVVNEDGSIDTSVGGKAGEVTYQLDENGKIVGGGGKIALPGDKKIGYNIDKEGTHTGSYETENTSLEVKRDKDGNISGSFGAKSEDLGLEFKAEASAEKLRVELTKSFEICDVGTEIPLAGILKLVLAFKAEGSIKSTNKIDFTKSAGGIAVDLMLRAEGSIGLKLDILIAYAQADLVLSAEANGGASIVVEKEKPTITLKKTVVEVGVGFKITVSLADWIKEVWEFVGGDKTSMEVVWDFGTANILNITLPGWQSGKGVTGELGYSEGKDIAKLLAEVDKYKAHVQPYIDAIKELWNKAVEIVEEIGKAIVEVAKFVAETLWKTFSGAYIAEAYREYKKTDAERAAEEEAKRKAMEKAHLDKKFQAAIQTVLVKLRQDKKVLEAIRKKEEVRKNSFNIFDWMRADNEVMNAILNDPFVKEIHKNIYVTKNDKKVDATIDQMMANINNFSVTPKKITNSLGQFVEFDLNMETDRVFPAGEIKLAVKCDNTVVVSSSFTANINIGKWKKTTKLQLPIPKDLPAGVQTSKGKWTIEARMEELPGDAQDKVAWAQIKVVPFVKTDKPVLPQHEVKKVKPEDKSQTLVAKNIKLNKAIYLLAADPQDKMNISFDLQTPNVDSVMQIKQAWVRISSGATTVYEEKINLTKPVLKNTLNTIRMEGLLFPGLSELKRHAVDYLSNFATGNWKMEVGVFSTIGATSFGLGNTLTRTKMNVDIAYDDIIEKEGYISLWGGAAKVAKELVAGYKAVEKAVTPLLTPKVAPKTTSRPASSSKK